MFLEEHDPTIEDSYIQNAEIDNELCMLYGKFFDFIISRVHGMAVSLPFLSVVWDRKTRESLGPNH